MLLQLRENKFTDSIPPIFNPIKSNASGGLLVENTSDKTIYVYIDITKPPCLPGIKGACSPPDSSENCDQYTLNDDNGQYSINYTKNGVDVCSWDNNDAKFYKISQEGQLNKIASKSTVELNKGESWFIQFPRDEDGVFWWCNNGVTNTDQRICPGLGLYVTSHQNTFSAACLNRYEFNINVNKDRWYDTPYDVQYTYHNLSSVDGFNSTMSLDIYQPYKCISKNKDPTKSNKVDCTGGDLTDIKDKCSKTLTYSTQELSVNSENDVNSILTCANPSHLNKNYEDHLACAMQSNSDKYDCTGMTDLYGIGRIDESATKYNYFEIDSRYEKITSKLDCHRYWDTTGSLDGISNKVVTWYGDESKKQSIFNYTNNGVQKYREDAQNYKNYIKDTLKCETYSWAFDEQTCSEPTCNNSECGESSVGLNPGAYLNDNKEDPLKKCPLLNPYVINSNNPSIDTTKKPDNYLYLHLKIGDVISDDDIDMENLIQGNEICSSKLAQVCQANCEGRDSQNPCIYNKKPDVNGKYCHPLDCNTYTADGKGTCESRKTRDDITLCKFDAATGICKNNMENYSVSGLCSSTVTKIGTQSLNPKNMEDYFY
jgi:hypothetical protein